MSLAAIQNQLSSRSLPSRSLSSRSLPSRSLSRRSLLQAGLLPGLLAVRGASAGAAGARAPGFGTARRCILLFMWGGPSQLDTFDMKPAAPAEVRGEFQPVSSVVPGLDLCEHFRGLATKTDLITVIRSMSHDDPAHLSSAHTTLTGHLPPVNKSDAEPPGPNDSPHLAGVLSRFHAAPVGLPGSVTMPWKTLHPAAPGGTAPGQTGGWLGTDADPLLVTGDPSRPDWSVPALRLADGLSLHRLQDRRSLLRSISGQQEQLDSRFSRQLDVQQLQAFEMLGSGLVRQAFDLSQESVADRQRYGHHIHGQCVLLGRRLLERGVPFVSVNWHNDGRNFWDTHGDNFNRLKRDLIPPADMALTALLTDLQDRGMLEDTLVVWTGEFGRRPQITAGNAGREHHPFCYSSLLAGAGIRRGAVYGSSDRIAGYPEQDAVSPGDLAATVLHAMGVPAEAMLKDVSGRPHLLYAGSPVGGVFG